MMTAPINMISATIQKTSGPFIIIPPKINELNRTRFMPHEKQLMKQEMIRIPIKNNIFATVKKNRRSR